jgi:RND family efflux transporter MFP subunit
MTIEIQPFWRKLLILPPLALGLVVLFSAAGSKPPPSKAERGELARAVRVIHAPRLDLVPSAEGYGAVQPARVWTAVTQVEGRVVEINPRLRDGEILLKDTLLLRIDPVDYELILAQAQAELAELAVQEQNARASLAIEERTLALTRKDLKRKRELATRGTTSESAADEAERTMLGTRIAVQNMSNTLALIPTKQRLLEARITQARRDLEHTSIRAPFNLRVANLQVERDQYVTKGQRLFEGDSVDRVEVVAQVSMSALRRLFIGHPDQAPDIEHLGEKLPEFVGLRPLIRLDLGNHTAEWEAEFLRFSDNVDPETRTMGVVVAVDKPFEKIKPGYRPPLSKGMFVQVVLRGKTQPDRVVVPRSAVRGGAIYIADADNRLRRRAVRVLFHQRRLSVISEGVRPGERVVVSDLVPAVGGMLLAPVVDEALTEELLAGAGGES